jgi:AcrR family transcriptional regulator
MADQKRPYRKKQRAELEAQTRRRITESTVELHSTLGPARTSISAVAERAGVRRSTVYRHFPDEAALFAACSAHWTALNPPPDLTGWAAIDDPDERLRSGLGQLYAYYRGTERMMENLHRDEATMPIIKRLFAGFRDYLSAAHETFMSGRSAQGRAHQRARATIGHALAFATWRSLTREQGLDDPEAADLMCRLADAASCDPDKPQRSRRGDQGRATAPSPT